MATRERWVLCSDGYARRRQVTWYPWMTSQSGGTRGWPTKEEAKDEGKRHAEQRLTWRAEAHAGAVDDLWNREQELAAAWADLKRYGA